jgi:hypothetical protein
MNHNASHEIENQNTGVAWEGRRQGTRGADRLALVSGDYLWSHIK